MRYLFLIFMIWLVGQCPAQSLAPVTKSKLDSMLISGARSAKMPGYAVCIIRNGDIVYECQTGMANIKRGIPIKGNTIFNIGSMAKQFTAMCIFLLEEEGKLALTDEIHQYLPELPDYGHPVTLAQLMSHTSGIHDHLEMLGIQSRYNARYLSVPNMLNYMRNVRSLNFQPGSDFAYCNTGYMMLACVVERVSGMSMSSFAQERIFEPLGMKNARFQGVRYSEMPDGTIAYEYNAANKKVKTTRERADALGATGVHCNAYDLVEWEKNFYQNRLGKASPDLIRKMETAFLLNNGQSSGYGGGLFIRQYHGYREIEHSGGWGDYMVQCRRFPELNMSVMVLCNSMYDSPFELAEIICNTLIPPPTLPELAPLPADIVPDSICGIYMSDNNWLRKVKHQGAQISIVMGIDASARAVRLGFQQMEDNRIIMADSAGNEVVFVLQNGRANAIYWSVSHYFLSHRVFNQLSGAIPSEFASLSGRYHSVDMHRTVNIKYNRRHNRLELRPFPFFKYPLIHQTCNIFQIKGEPYLIRFTDQGLLAGDMWNTFTLHKR